MFQPGERVRVLDGPFEGYEGIVFETLPETGLVRVLVHIFGRQTHIDIEDWMLGKANET
jgi:transcriptional antiterminator NusG